MPIRGMSYSTKIQLSRLTFNEGGVSSVHSNFNLYKFVFQNNG